MALLPIEEANALLRGLMSIAPLEWNYSMGCVGYKCAYCGHHDESSTVMMSPQGHSKECPWGLAWRVWNEAFSAQEAQSGNHQG